MEFKSRNRQDFEAIEQSILAPFAVQSQGTNSTRQHDEAEHAYRTNFQRDRDRLIHSRAFRRLKHKRQVFLITTGDHYRTRLTHTLEVVQLSRTIARALGLNEDLTEAIALGHDLGHTPFGHIGEVVLHRVLQGADDLEGALQVQRYGGFKHNYQSVRVVDCLEIKYRFDGLNLTRVVREGILKHTAIDRSIIRYPDWQDDDLRMDFPNAASLEGQVVATCDEIAQRTHDLEDGMRAGFVTITDVRQLPIVQLTEERFGFSYTTQELNFQYIGRLVNHLIHLLVTDVIETTVDHIRDYYQRHGSLYPFADLVVTFGKEIDPLQKDLDQFIDKCIIHRQGIGWADDLAVYVIRGLFRAYLNRPNEMQSFPTYRYLSHNLNWQSPQEEARTNLAHDQNFVRLVADYIAGMTDHFAMKEYERLVGA